MTIHRTSTPVLNKENTNILKAIERLSPDKLSLILSLVNQMDANSGSDASEGNGYLDRPSDGISTWVAALKSERYSESSIKVYRYNAERYLKNDPEPTKLKIQSYIAKRLEEGISPAMVEVERKSLRSLFSFLHQEGLWPNDPTATIKHIKVPYGERSCPTPDEVKKVINVGCFRARDTLKIRTLVILLATTGLRIHEATSLRKESIDFDARELRIVGKGEKYRVVPMLESTVDILRDYVERNPNDSPYVFPGNGKTGHADRCNIEKTLQRACLRAGVRPFTPHGLRHFYATEMLKKGAKLEIVGRILGHSSIGITADIYRHVSTDEMHEEHLKFAPMS